MCCGKPIADCPTWNADPFVSAVDGPVQMDFEDLDLTRDTVSERLAFYRAHDEQVIARMRLRERFPIGRQTKSARANCRASRIGPRAAGQILSGAQAIAARRMQTKRKKARSIASRSSRAASGDGAGKNGATAALLITNCEFPAQRSSSQNSAPYNEKALGRH